MMKKLISMLVVVLVYAFTLFSTSVNAESERIISGKTVYCSPSPTVTEAYTVYIPQEGDMIVNLKTDGGVIIVIKDENEKIHTPYEKQKISGYMSDSGKYGVREWGFDDGEANFTYHLKSGVYKISLSSEYPHTEPSSVIMTVTTPPAEISVTLNGKNVNFDQPPIIENGRTLVPVRAIFEALGASVEWQQETQTVIAKRDEKSVSLTISSNVMKVGNKEVLLDVPAQIISNRTLVPARAVAEAFNCKVDWDNDTKTVLITN